MKSFERISVFAVLAVLAAAFILFPETLLAASDPFSNIVDKVGGVKNTIFAVAKIIAIIGVIIGGVKKVLGHPDAWTWLWSAGLGTIIIFSADAIVTWLSN